MSSRKIRSLLVHPERTAIDIRLLSQIELNIIRTEAYTKIIGRNSDFITQNDEDHVRTVVDDASVELSLWLDEWTNIAMTEPVPHQRALALQNLHVQREWALMVSTLLH
jgi:hypothetical protein